MLLILSVLLTFGAASPAKLAIPLPILVWSTYDSFRTPWLESLSAFEVLLQNTFTDLLHSETDDSTFIVAFVEHKLSTEHFMCQMNGRSSLRRLFNLHRMASSFYHPITENPVEGLLDVVRTGIPPADKVFLADETWSSVSGKYNITFFRDVDSDDDPCQVLRSHDGFIVNTYNDIASKHRRVLALYTGRWSTWDLEPLSRKARKAFQARSAAPVRFKTDDESFSFHNLTELYLVLGQLFLTVEDEETTEIVPYQLTQLIRTVKNSLVANDTVVVKTSEGNLEITVTPFSSHWKVTLIEFIDPEGVIEELTSSVVISARMGKSFLCSRHNVLSGKGFNISFDYLQLQPFLGDPPPADFADADNCERSDSVSSQERATKKVFTSAGIASGIVVVAFLISILTLGIRMLMNINTPDRFDKPDRPNISVKSE